MFDHPATKYAMLLLLLPLGLDLGGCATQGSVQQEMGAMNKRLDELSGRLETAYRRIDANALMILDANKRVAATESDSASLGQRIDGIQSGLSQNTVRIDGLDGTIKASQQRLEANAGEIAHAQQRLDAIDTALKTAAGTPAPVNTAAEMPEHEVAGDHAATATEAQPTSSARLDEIAAQIAATNRGVGANTASLRDASERLGKIETRLTDVEGRTQASAASLDEMSKRVGEIQEQVSVSQQRGNSNAEAIASVSKRIDALQANLESSLKQQGERMVSNEAEDSQIAASAKEALNRAMAAGKLAEGKLVYEKVITEETSGFAPYKTSLTKADKETLKQFAEKLLAENKGVYLEIQGYTDNTGPAALNLKLSRQRAENVRAFLHDSGIPLHRMTVAAYGENRPVADNKTREGRHKNRRVVIVVLE